MKALSVRQPWASLIASGKKTIEVRSRRTSHRGPLLICASQSTSVSGHGLAAARVHGLDVADLPRGVALCIVTLADSREPVDGDDVRSGCPIADDEFAWVLSNLKPVEPFPVRGALGLFPVELPTERLRTGNP